MPFLTYAFQDVQGRRKYTKYINYLTLVWRARPSWRVHLHPARLIVVSTHAALEKTPGKDGQTQDDWLVREVGHFQGIDARV
jgi:hypothetical protein